ncbi:MAG: nuclear transport factor 2 family protein [Bacteroidia bacterium]
MSTQVVYDFADAINEHNVELITGMMTDDHTFIDAHNNKVTGRETMKNGWAMYFQWFPDYKIEIDEIYVNGDSIAALGFASGTYKGIAAKDNINYWRLPAAWKAVVEKGKIKLWQVYADTRIPFDIIERNKL